MSRNLPPELWLHIFSYLDLEELVKAREACKAWWDLIDSDYLWKPKLLRRGIDLNSINLENAGNENGRLSSQWAQLHSSYYRQLATNWANQEYAFTRFPDATCGVAVRLPYMVRTFDLEKKHVVEVHRLVRGDFEMIASLPLPVEEISDEEEEDDDLWAHYEPCMTSDNVFAVSMHTTIIIFKLNGNQCTFVKAIQFLGYGSIFLSSDTKDIPHFSFGWDNEFWYRQCRCVTDNVIWLEARKLERNRIIFVWDYTCSKLLLQLEIISFLGCSTDYVFLSTLSGELSIHSLNGDEIWSGGCDVTSVSWNKFGCAFVDKTDFPKRTATFLELPNLTCTNIVVDHPEVIALHKTEPIAYCLCLRGIRKARLTSSSSSSTSYSLARITSISLQNGDILWQVPSLKTIPINSPRRYYKLQMNVVLGKYLTIFGLDNPSGRHDGDNSLHVCSALDGRHLGEIYIDPGSAIDYLSDEFILTSVNNFEFYNFLSREEQGVAEQLLP